MPTIVFIRQTLKSLTKVKTSVKTWWQFEVEWPGNSEPAHLGTYDLFFMQQMTKQEKSKEQENMQHTSHLEHLHNTFEILMLSFNVLKCLNTVCQHYRTLSVSHIIPTLQLRQEW